MMIGNKRGQTGGFKTALGVLFVIVAMTLLFFIIRWSVSSIDNLNIPEPRTTAIFVSYLNNEYVQPFFIFLFGEQALQTDQLFVIVLAILCIILFAFSDILKMFSTFSETTSWVIASALTLIVSALGVSRVIITALGVTAAAGLYLVLIMIFGSFVAALIINLGLGSQLQEWAIKRKAAQDAVKTGKTVEEMRTAVKFLKETSKVATGP